MINSTFVSHLASKIQDIVFSEHQLPTMISKDEIIQLLTEALSNLDLVSREEFDIQQQVLQNARLKLDKLTQVIENLEQLSKKNVEIAD